MFDTSALIEWIRHYPVDIFPRVWRLLDDLLSSGAVSAPREVREEILERADELADWCKARPSFFVELDNATEAEVMRLQRHYAGLTDPNAFRTEADPFVIAVAKLRGATVVTAESYKKSPQKPRIPYVCEMEGIRCIKPLGLMRELKWVFG